MRSIWCSSNYYSTISAQIASLATPSPIDIMDEVVSLICLVSDRVKKYNVIEHGGLKLADLDSRMKASYAMGKADNSE